MALTSLAEVDRAVRSFPLNLCLVVGLLALVVLGSAACGDVKPVGGPKPTRDQLPAVTPTTPPTASPTLAQVPSPIQTPQSGEPPAPTAVADTAVERIDWTPCGDGLECGFVDVPEDYGDPEASSISIAVNLHRATSPESRIGYLLVNPGGPGESGVELVEAVSIGLFSEEVVAHFDIVGFDPRGVGSSDPTFRCGELGEQLALPATINGPVDHPDEMTAGEAAANLCIESMGLVGGLLHSAYVARDMDEIRKALGADRISYLGFSYGSTLGVWYATLFPESVRTMVVDGAVNPVKPVATQRERIDEEIEQAGTFAAFLERALDACLGPECPIFNDGDPVGYFYKAVEKLHIVNAAAGHPLAGSLGVISTLYSEDTWPDLWYGLYELKENDDPFILLEYSSIQLGLEPDAASFTVHVNCLDDWVLHPELDRATRLDDLAIADAAIRDRFPLLAALVDPYEPDVCPFYDQFAPESLDRPLNGSGVPILVIGNHDDPFTAFRESEELVTETLANGYLLETYHPSHVVYPYNECVNQHVHSALIDGLYPDERRVLCKQEG